MIKKRTDYLINDPLEEGNLNPDPMLLFGQWYELAAKEIDKDPNAMALSTYDGEYPRTRIVLMKEFNDQGFVYFTNYSSDKAEETKAHPKASITFYWKELERQARVQGSVEKISDQASDQYYNSRPLGSRIGAWASPQSKEIPNREWLEEKVKELSNEFTASIKRPAYWGGLRLVPEKIEFWQGQSSRLHDRILYTKEEGQWAMKRLAP
jgi:pyridoxamine 5'-phosphate oxidase